MRTVNLRAFPGYFVCCAALLAGCSDSGTVLPNTGTAGATTSTAGTSTNTDTAGTTSTGGSSATAGSATTAGSPSAGTETGGGMSSGGAAVAGSSTGGSGGGEVVGFQRPKGQVPNTARDPGNVGIPKDDWKKAIVSTTMNDHKHHGQPTVLNGYLNLNGNEEYWFWDIADPKNPKQVSEYLTPNREPKGGEKGEGEAESHCVTYGRYGDKFYQATTQGHGFDIWDVTDVTSVKHVKQVKLDGINYGDFTQAVWGLSWQGNYLYIGGTDQGLFVIDVHDPANPTVAKHLATSSFGTVSAGPLDAIGNMLVITTPKESAGIATLDISDPVNPKYMHSVKPSAKSYIGMFYRHYVYLQSPLRSWDVLTDPFNIGTADKPLSSINTPASEYLSFGDNHVFLGRMRDSTAGVSVYDGTDPAKGTPLQSTVYGRLDRTGNDDQFALMIGNLLSIGDDQEPYYGSVLVQWAADPDTKPPVVDTVIPKDKAAGQAVTSRIGISFTDNIEFTTVNAASFIVRPVGGEPIKGTWGSRMGVVNFSPNEDLMPATTYEVILPKGGITDLTRNAIAADFKSTFTTK